MNVYFWFLCYLFPLVSGFIFNSVLTSKIRKFSLLRIHSLQRNVANLRLFQATELSNEYPITHNITRFSATENDEILELIEKLNVMSKESMKNHVKLTSDQKQKLTTSIKHLLPTFQSKDLLTIMYYLGRLQFSRLNYGNKPLLNNLFVQFFEKLKENEESLNDNKGISIFIAALDSLEYNWKDLEMKEKEGIRYLLERISQWKSCGHYKNYVRILGALVKLEIPKDEIAQILMIKLIHELPNIVSSIEGSYRSSLIMNLGKLGIKTSDFTSEEEKAVIQIAYDGLKLKDIENMKYDIGRHVSHIIHGLADLGFNIREDKDKGKGKEGAISSSKLRSAIIKAVKNSLQKMNGWGKAMTIYGLGKLGMRWKEDFPNSLKENIREILFPSFALSGLSSMLNGLKEMGYFNDWETNKNTSKVKNAIFNSIIENCKTLRMKGGNVRGLSTLLYYLGEIGIRIQWNKKNDTISQKEEEVSQSILKGIEQFHRLFSPQQCSHIIFGLHKMGMKWDKISKFNRRLLIQTIERNSKAFLPLDFTQIISSLGSVRVNWNDDLSESLKENLLERIRKYADKLPSHQISQIIFGLGLCHADFNDPKVNSLIHQLLEEYVLKENDFPLRMVNLLIGLSNMEVQWKDMQVKTCLSLRDVIEGAIPDFNINNLAIAMYATILLSFPIIEMKEENEDQAEKRQALIRIHRLLTNKYDEIIKTKKTTIFKPIEITQIAIYFELMKNLFPKEFITKIFIDGRYLPVIEIPNEVMKEEEKENHELSEIHKSLSNDLQKELQRRGKKHWKVENKWFGISNHLFAIDIVIKDEEKQEIISMLELDGPHHYRKKWNGGKALRRIDQLKEQLYKKAFPRLNIERIENLNLKDEEGWKETINKLVDKWVSSGVK